MDSDTKSFVISLAISILFGFFMSWVFSQFGRTNIGYPIVSSIAVFVVLHFFVFRNGGSR